MTTDNDMAKTIQFQFTKGSICTIDEQDVDLLRYKWSELVRGQNIYGKSTKRIDGKQRLIHGMIFTRVLGRPLQSNERVDHIDNNSLNCTRSNLRLASHSQNLANSRLSKRNSSGYKGVSFNKPMGKWNAKIGMDGKLKDLGHYDTPEQAYEAYKAAAIEQWGEFAKV